MCFASAFPIQRTDSHPIQGSLGHAWNAVFLPIFAAYGSSSGGLNYGRDGPVTHKFFSFWDLEHFSSQPTSQRTCFSVISGPTASLNQPTHLFINISEHTASQVPPFGHRTSVSSSCHSKQHIKFSISGQPTSQRTCFSIISGPPTASLNQPPSQHTRSFHYFRAYSLSSFTYQPTD